MTSPRQQLARRILAHHSKSFSWGARLLPVWCRADATTLYAWCRRCDDAVDVPTDQAVALRAAERLRAELADVYDGAEYDDEAEPVLAGFQELVRRHAIPRRYVEDLIDGMAMDIGPVRYRTVDELLLYCYRVAGTVGLMMAHVMKVRDTLALRRAVDLGMAMQLTNICRDVDEDERRGRVYVPMELWGANTSGDGEPGPTPEAVATLLRRADMLYESGDLGLAALPLRCAVAIAAARAIYADIGTQLERRGYDLRAGRAVVPWMRKLRLAAGAVLGAVPQLWRRVFRRAASGRDGGPLPQVLPFELSIDASSWPPLATKGRPFAARARGAEGRP